MKHGDGGRIVVEPLCWVEEYPIEWQKPKFNLAELAKLRWIDGISTKDLVSRLGKTEVAIRNHYRRMKKINFQISGLTEFERKRIIWASKN